jgi:LysM repeat protein
MPLELIKEYLEVDQEVRRFTTQTIIEENVIVPDYKPDIEKVLSVRGDIHVNNKVIEGEKFFVEGMVDCKVMYQALEEGVKLQHINMEIPFSHWIEVEEEGDIQAIVQTRMEYIDYELVNTRKLNIRGVLGMQGKFTKKEQYPLLNNIKGLEDMQMLRNWVKITTIADKASEQAMVKEQINLEDMPQVIEIIKTQARVLEKEIKVTEGRIMINGSVEVEIIYIGEAEENQSIEYVEYQLPLAHFLELPGITEDMEYQLNFNVEDILTQVQTNEEGVFNIIDIEAIVDIKGTIYQDHDVESIVDAYSPSIQTNLHKEKINCQEMVLNEKTKTIVKEKISTSIEQEGIDDVLSIEGIVKVTEAQRLDDQWIVEGLVEIEMLYRIIGEQEGYESIKKEIPFRQGFELDTENEVYGDVSANIHHLGYQLLSADEIELKVTLDIQCQIFKPVIFHAINDIEELSEIMEEESKEAKISVYFKQPNDSLWEIAKRYRITIEEVLSQNDIPDQDNIPNFKPIIISKKDRYTLK